MTHHEHPNANLVREGSQAFERGDTAWMDEHLADDVVWHVGGNSKWAGDYEGKENVLGIFARQVEALGGKPPSTDIHDILGNDDHVVVLGTASVSAPDGSSAEWKYVQVFHVKEGKATEVWGTDLQIVLHSDHPLRRQNPADTTHGSDTEALRKTGNRTSVCVGTRRRINRKRGDRHRDRFGNPR